MVDYKLNSDMEIFRNEWGDFVTVDGLEEFEQSVLLQLNVNESPFVGSLRRSNNLKQKIRLAINRTAQHFDVIDAISSIDVTLDGGTTTAEVTVTYYTGDTFSEEV